MRCDRRLHRTRRRDDANAGTYSDTLFDKDLKLAYAHHPRRRDAAVASGRLPPRVHAPRIVLGAARRMSAARATAIWAALAAVVALLLVASLSIGSVPMSPWQALASLVPHGGDAATHDVLFADIVRTLRLPRALAGFACGALLALAGALLQVLLRNPLAEPYVLGVSGGAAGFALVAMIAGGAWWLVDASAFAGALVSIALVLGLARRELWRGETRDASPRLLLTGVVIAAGWGALVTLLLSLAPDARLRGIIFWLTGDLNGASAPWFAGGALLLAAGVALPAAPQLNVLLRGDATALALGVPVARLRMRIYLVASLAAAAAVTTAGTIGFVGLVVPHALRLAFGNDQRMLLPAAMLAGGGGVMAADLLARTAIAPAQLPVGVMTALIGVPVFLWMLLRRPMR
ncbi:Hemin transport system permease protein HmuU [Burkholderia pseudomultivorans]|uniref:Hemin transport system permease protein HmuU n=2 Tax=Burkholderia pseudomultivorans TaxID=1207504 RepID=A0ABU2E022_9BURK|nr:Hemin transport system permease protein HmuU [Burkholderia pseudomultivorans]MDR8733407.1 Hemin transport system permease protein HmuU [Burkholderia pseudomultivorans]MDR8741778.1 Hemin transport system permease protein HmuU [Burkholderia pseudomultivorans]MDR8753034.1 Hemin transport system permease protein HmuU [Burkholderia pseudomultivorans]MDR8776380.1 Hemin transport system permease protein HmuU [Burkholderia pseudomultivorans]